MLTHPTLVATKHRQVIKTHSKATDAQNKVMYLSSPADRPNMKVNLSWWRNISTDTCEHRDVLYFWHRDNYSAKGDLGERLPADVQYTVCVSIFSPYLTICAVLQHLHVEFSVRGKWESFDFPVLRFSGNSGSSYSSGDETLNNTCVIYTEILIVTTFLWMVKITL